MAVVLNRPEPQPYSAARFPALELYLPFTETSGLAFTDLVAGRVWRPELTSTEAESSVFSVPNAVSLVATQPGLYELVGDIDGAAIPSPGSSKAAVTLVVLGPTELPSNLDDYWYLRFGHMVSGPGRRVGSIVFNANSKSDFANPFKILEDLGTGAIVATAVTPTQAAIASSVALCYEWLGASVRGSQYVNEAVWTATKATTVPATYIDNHFQMEIEANVGQTQSIYSLQYWLFDSMPPADEIKAACLWTRDKALAGIKAPFPGWAGRA